MWAGEAAMIRKYFRLAQNSAELYRENINDDTTGNKDMCNVERRAKSSGVNSSCARTVAETATAYATVL